MNSIVSFGTEFQGKMKNIKMRWNLSEAKKSQFCPSNIRAGLATDASLYFLMRDTVPGKSARQVFIGKTADGQGYCEISSNNEKQIALVKKNDSTINIKAMVLNEFGASVPYDARNRKGSVIAGAFIGMIYGLTAEIATAVNVLEQYYDYDENNDVWDDAIVLEEFGKEINLLSNSLYYFEKMHTVDYNRIATLRIAEKDQLASSGKLIPLYGEPITVTLKSIVEQSSTLTTGMYEIHPGRVFNEEEKKLIPNLPSSYILPAWVETTCKELRDSAVFAEPFRNVLLSGPAGSGKTKGAVAMAQACGLPYVKLTCSPDTDTIELFGQLLPNTTGPSFPADLPTFEDVENDYEGTFKKLFGKDAGKFNTPADCYNEIFKRAIEASKNDFTYVESDFIKAIRNGWLVEIQEPTVIKRNAVLVGLNAILENDRNSCITLITGEVIKRHPDTIVVMTTNADYDGCNKIQQSVLSRMEVVRSIANPEAKELAERACSNVGIKSPAYKAVVQKMATYILEAAKYAAEKDIRDGICGPRELLSWVKAAVLAQAAKDNNKPFESKTLEDDVLMSAAFHTVFEKLSQTPDDMEDLITGVFAKAFNQTDIEIARENYSLGIS